LKSLVIALFTAICLSCVLAGCASNRSTTGIEGSGRGSGVEVFGTIDTGVSRTTTKSAPAR